MRHERRTPYDVLSHFISPDMIEYVEAIGDRIAFEQCLSAIRDLTEPENIELVTNYSTLFVGELLIKDLPHLLEHGVIDSKMISPLKEWYDNLIRKCAVKAEFLIAKWNVPKDAINVPIASREYIKNFEQAVAENSVRPKL